MFGRLLIAAVIAGVFGVLSDEVVSAWRRSRCDAYCEVREMYERAGREARAVSRGGQKASCGDHWGSHFCAELGKRS
jgi:hypothetical protein